MHDELAALGSKQAERTLRARNAAARARGAGARSVA